MVFSLTAAAAVFDSGADLNRTREALERGQLREDLREENRRIDEEEEARKEREAASARSMPAVPQVSVFLQKVEFTPPSQVLPESELRALAAKYERREVAVRDLYQLVEEINRLYKARGYITAMALLTRQEIRGGVVRILLIEGKVGQVELENNRSTRGDYILDRIDLPKGKVPNMNDLDRQLQWFNGTNDAKLAVQLGAGREPGTTDFSITANEPDRHQLTLMSDSAGRRDIGHVRYGAGYTNASLTGRRDSLSIVTLFSRSSETALVQYSAPINRLGTRLAAYYNGNRMRVTDGDLESFHVKGKADYFGLTLTHPIFVETRFKQDLTLDVQKQKSSTEVFGMEFVNDREYRASLGTGLTWYGVGEVFYFKPVVMHGRYEGLAEKKEIGRLRADFIWQKQDRHENSYSVAVAAQKALNHRLPSSDQFYIGGMYSVRGYRESVLSADNGFSANFEARFPVKRLNSSLLLFYDAGKLSGKNTLATRTLSAAGFGIGGAFFKGAELTVSVGFPFQKKILGERVDDWRAHFALNIRL
jgi:hemolysin activation/secretion protein